MVELRTDAQNKSKNYLIQDFDADSVSAVSRVNVQMFTVLLFTVLLFK